MKVKDCMCQEAYYCSPDNTVRECAKMMNEKHIGCVPVCDVQKNIVGMVTDRDIVLRCIANGKDAQSTKLSEIMSTEVCFCRPEEELNNIQNHISKIQVKRIPVVNENNEFIGMVSLKDLADHNQISKEQIGKAVENICNCNNKNYC